MIRTETEYSVVLERIEELSPLVNEDTPMTDRNLIEMELLLNLVADYNEFHYPMIVKLSLPKAIRFRMSEMGLTRKDLSELLQVSPSMVGKYLSGKSEPTLKVAREICKKLDIDANIVLGV